HACPSRVPRELLPKDARAGNPSFFGHETTFWHDDRTTTVPFRFGRALLRSESPGRRFRQSCHAAETGSIRARTRFRGQKMAGSLHGARAPPSFALRADALAIHLAVHPARPPTCGRIL